MKEIQYARWPYRDLMLVLGVQPETRNLKNPSLDEVRRALMRAAPKLEQVGGMNKVAALSFQAEAFFKGVAIQADHNELIDALLRTDVTCHLHDITVPYYMIEFAFPEGFSSQLIPFQLKPFLMIDPAGTELGSGLIPHGFSTQGNELLLMFENHLGGESTLVFNRHDTLQANLCRIRTWLATAGEPNVHIAVYEMYARLAFSLLLYIQSLEGMALLEDPIPTRYHRLTPVVARRDRHRRHLIVRPLIPRKREHSASSASDQTEPAGWKQPTHWRRGSFRLLKSPRYRRSPDGSILCIWVPPYLVNPQEDPHESIGQIRTLNRGPQAQNAA